MSAATRQSLAKSRGVEDALVIAALAEAEPELRAAGYTADRLLDNAVALLIVQCGDLELDAYDVARRCEGGPIGDDIEDFEDDGTPLSVWLRRLVDEIGVGAAGELLARLAR